MNGLTQVPNRSALKSVSENARTGSGSRWAYTPGAHPTLDRELEQRAAMGGAIWDPHLLGQSFLSFGDFLQRAEVLEYLSRLFPVGSDQAFALRWLRERSHEFLGDRKTSRTKLTTLIRECPLFDGRGYRHVQNTFGAIFDQYDDLLKKQQRNLKLIEEPLRRAQRHKAYDLREEKRKAKRIWVRK